jgi:hypothetical protein
MKKYQCSKSFPTRRLDGLAYSLNNKSSSRAYVSQHKKDRESKSVSTINHSQQVDITTYDQWIG